MAKVDMLSFNEDLIKSATGKLDLNTLNKSLYRPEQSILNYEENLMKSMPAESVTAYLENPFRLNDGLGYKNKASTISFDILQQMAAKCSVISAIINTRVNQVGLFSRPARDTADHIGFQIKLKDSSSTETQEDKRLILSLEQFIEQCGYSYDPYRDCFDTFLRKYVRDSLTYDQACFEIVPDKKGRPAEIICVDASTIRAVSYDSTNPDIGWAQIINGAIEAYFKKTELAFGIRNPRSNINVQPYGYSELEMLIQQVTSQLYAEDYNAKFFSNGGMTRGILNIKVDPTGVGNREMLNAFKAQWRAQVNSLTGAWKTPVVQIPGDVEFVNIGQVPSDMMFGNYMSWLVNIACAIYAIDPAEINFPNNGGVSGTSAVFEGNRAQALKNSKDKGLKPLLKFIESEINKHIIRRFSNRLSFQFVGLDESSEAERLELDGKVIKLYKTINEIRQEHGLEPIENGDVILDPSWMNFNNQVNMMANSGMMGGGAPVADSATFESSEKPNEEGATENSGVVDNSDEVEKQTGESATDDETFKDSEVVNGLSDEDKTTLNSEVTDMINSSDLNSALEEVLGGEGK